MLNIFTKLKPMTPYYYLGQKVILLNTGWKNENGKFEPWVTFYWYDSALKNKHPYLKRVSRIDFIINAEKYDWDY